MESGFRKGGGRKDGRIKKDGNGKERRKREVRERRKARSYIRGRATVMMDKKKFVKEIKKKGCNFRKLKEE